MEEWGEMALVGVVHPWVPVLRPLAGIAIPWYTSFPGFAHLTLRPELTGL